MLKSLSRSWWMLTLKGILLIIFGLFAFFSTTITAATLALYFAILIIIDGVFTIVAAIRSWQDEEDHWLILAEGILSLIIGTLLFLSPGLTLLIVSFTIAFWFIFIGISRIAMAIQIRKEIEGEGWMILGGVLMVAFGCIIFARPALGYESLTWLIGMFCFLAGIVILMVSFRIRKAAAHIKEHIHELKEESM